MSDLLRYSLKSQNLGLMSGVSVGVHAIPDAFLLMHTGVGCKYKAASQIANHDWQRHPNRREGWTEVGDQALIKGSADRIGPYARSWAARRAPGVMVMVTSTFLDMTGEDFGAAIRATERDLDCPVIQIDTPGFDGDLYAGFARLVAAIAGQVDWQQAGQTRPDEVGLLGYFFDRYEADHLGNLQQLRFLLDGIGLKLGPVLLSGRPYADLLRLGGAGHLLSLPHMAPAGQALQDACPRAIQPVDLPFGLSGSAAWLRAVASATGIGAGRLESFIDAQRKHARPELAKVADRFRGLPVALFAETPLAAGLCCLLLEMGLRPRLIGLRDASLGGRPAFARAVERAGHELPADLDILEHPSLLQIADCLDERAKASELGLVIGSAVERNLMNREPGRAGAFIEIGFPSTHFHATRAEPILGFGGAVAFAQRVINT